MHPSLTAILRPPARPGLLRLLPAAALALLGSCGGAPDPPRNLLLVTIDTTRADHIGAYGAVRASTPTLDSLAERGVLFETCIAPTPTTVPSHASILSGLYPYHHGARNNGTHRLGDEITTLAERLSTRGYNTGAVVSARVLDARYGLNQGFDTYNDDLSGSDTPQVFMVRDTRADQSVGRARAWLEECDEEQPFFLWLHLFDPHANYEPPEPFATRFKRAPYDGEIAFADQQVGELLKYLDERGQLDDTLVVVTSDHGESLLEHGEPTHGIFIYDATTHVPLILAHPSLPAGRRVAGISSSVDIVPTALELLGAPPASGLDGISLVPTLRSPGANLPERRAYCESLLPRYNNGWSDLRSLRGEDWRYIEAPRQELYDLPRDPRERRNVVDAHPDVHADFAGDLEQRLASGEVETLDGSLDSSDPEERAMLEELGYIVRKGDDVDVLAEDLPDPKDMAKVMLEEFQTRQLLQEGKFEEALPIFERLAEEDPNNTFTLASYSMALAECGQIDAAIEVMEGLVPMKGARAENFVNLARLRRKADRDDWREVLHAAQARFPRHAISWSWEGLWAVEEARFHEARSLFEKALEIDADAVESWGGLGQVEYHLGNLREAERYLRRARELDPHGEGVLYYLGQLLEKTGRYAEAIEVYADSLGETLDASDVNALISTGTLAGQHGDAEYGEELLRKALEFEPDHYGARLNLGILLVASGREAEGAAELEQCTSQKPKRNEAWYPLFAARRSTGPPEKLLEAAEGVLRFDPRRADVLRAAAQASRALGDTERAADYEARAKAL